MTPIINVATTDLQFCWAGVCYPVGTLVSGQTASLDSGQLVIKATDSYGAFIRQWVNLIINPIIICI